VSSVSIHAVLIPLDGSSFSQRAVAYGIYFAKKMNIQLIGIHARTRGDSSAEETFIEIFLEDCRRSGISMELRQTTDLSSAAILEATADQETGLFLIPRPDRLELQSTQNKPAHLAFPGAPYTLMVIPPEFREIESMGLIYNGCSEGDHSLDLAVSLSRQASWPLTILLPSEDPFRIDSLSRQLEDYFDQLTGEPLIDWDTVVLSGQQGEAAFRFLLDGSIELLVMSRPDLDSSMVMLLNKSPIPVIVTL
jgi:hypothetical protein